MMIRIRQSMIDGHKKSATPPDKITFMASGADDEFAEVNKILHHFYGLNNRLLRFIGFGNVWAN